MMLLEHHDHTFEYTTLYHLNHLGRSKLRTQRLTRQAGQAKRAKVIFKKNTEKRF